MRSLLLGNGASISLATDEEVISAITQFLILLWVISSTPLSEERQNVRLNVPRSWLQPESFGFET